MLPTNWAKPSSAFVSELRGKEGSSKAAVSLPKIPLRREEMRSCDWPTLGWRYLAVESKRFYSASVFTTNIEIFDFAVDLQQLLAAMEQIDRNHKKQSNMSELPSCFLTPESPGDLGRMTPNFETSPSSVFLTPPCSQEKVWSPQFQSLSLDGLPKLTFELEDGDQERSMQRSLQRSPLLPEDRIIGRLIGTNYVDIISDLMAVNCNKICQRICSYLKPLDLCRYGYVLVAFCSLILLCCLRSY